MSSLLRSHVAECKDSRVRSSGRFDARSMLVRVPIRARLLGGFLTILVVMASIAVLALQDLNEVGAVVTHLVRDDLREVLMLAETHMSVVDIERQLVHLLLQHPDRAAHLAQLEAIDRTVALALRAYEEKPPRPADAMLMGDLGARYRRLGQLTARFRALLETGRDVEALRLLHGPWEERHEAVVRATTSLLSSRVEAMTHAVDVASARTRSSRAVLVATAAVGVVFSVLFTVAITRSITGPIGALMTATANVMPGTAVSHSVRASGDEIARLAGRFEDLMAVLARSLEQQRQFFADASHQLRTPVTVISGEAEVALRGAAKTPAEYRESLGTILNVAKRMSRLVDEFLFLARSSAGQLSCQMSAVSLEAVVGDVYLESRGLAAKKGVALEVDCDGEVTVHGDAERLMQLFMILVDNAIKYTPAEGRVRIALRRTAQKAEVSVSDTGRGISDLDRPLIFARFYRGKPATAKSPDGTGLGLAIAREISAAHGGTIDVSSVEGAGSTFTVALPVAEA
jgi:signal transduction histidine kinase